MAHSTAEPRTTTIAIEVTTMGLARTLPFDINAERAVIGRSLLHPRFHREARCYLDADDMWIPEHRRLWHALDTLDDIGDWIGPEYTDDTWRPVLGWRVRCSAAALIAECEATIVAGLALLAGDLRTNAAVIVEHAERRRRILALEQQITELAS